MAHVDFLRHAWSSLRKCAYYNEMQSHWGQNWSNLISQQHFEIIILASCQAVLDRALLVPKSPPRYQDQHCSIKAILAGDEEERTTKTDRVYLKKRRKCAIRLVRIERKTREICMICEQLMCDEHRAFLRNNCARVDQSFFHFSNIIDIKIRFFYTLNLR